MRLRSDADATAIAAFFDRHRLVTPQTRHLPDKQAHWSSLHPMPCACACDCRTKLESVSAFQPLLRIELAERPRHAKLGASFLLSPSVYMVPDPSGRCSAAPSRAVVAGVGLLIVLGGIASPRLARSRGFFLIGRLRCSPAQQK
jgi:hypothetical protein